MSVGQEEATRVSEAIFVLDSAKGDFERAVKGVLRVSLFGRGEGSV